MTGLKIFLLFILSIINLSKSKSEPEDEIEILIRDSINSNSLCHIHLIQDVGSVVGGPFRNPLTIVTTPLTRLEFFFYHRCQTFSISVSKIRGISCIFLINYRLTPKYSTVNAQYDGYAFYPASKVIIWMTCCILSVKKQKDLWTIHLHVWSVWEREEVLPIMSTSVLLLLSPLNRKELRQSFLNVYETILLPNNTMLISYTDKGAPFQRKRKLKITKYFRHPYPRKSTDLIQEYKMALFNLETFKTFVDSCVRHLLK